MIKKDFPIFERKINGKRLVYLDSASTSQKPKTVIDAISDFYSNHNANSHRGIYKLSEESTDIFENTRKIVAKFINAKPDEISFTKSATEGLNSAILTTPFKHWKEEINGSSVSRKKMELATTVMEHHSNLVPMQQFARMSDSKLNIIDVDSEGTLIDWEKSINQDTKLVSITGMSNVLGSQPNIKEITKYAHDIGAEVIIDGAQLVAHSPVDVKRIGCDFISFSAHKMLGPTGVGVLFKSEQIEREPFLTGGTMISEVTEQNSTWTKAPLKYEAGTQNLAGVAGFSEAIKYLNKIGMEKVEDIEKKITQFAVDNLQSIDKVKLYGSKRSIISFELEGIHPHDIASILDSENVNVRAGHHCAMPLMTRLKVPALTRVSPYIYNTREDIELLIEGIKKTIKVFS